MHKQEKGNFSYLLMLMWGNRKCEPDNISISTMKQEYLVSAEIQAKIVPNPARISSFKMASSLSKHAGFL